MLHQAAQYYIIFECESSLQEHVFTISIGNVNGKRETCSYQVMHAKKDTFVSTTFAKRWQYIQGHWHTHDVIIKYVMVCGWPSVDKLRGHIMLQCYASTAYRFKCKGWGNKTSLGWPESRKCQQACHIDKHSKPW